MNIAISGRLGSGKSTICGILKNKYGFDVYSTGQIQRRFAEEMGISTLELNKKMVGDNGLDHFIDNGVKELSRKDKNSRIIFDSRMAWHFAENRFAVYVFADPTVAAARVYNDSARGKVEAYNSVEDAKSKLYARSREENRRYKELYNVNNFDYANYDMVIDSTYVSAEAVADMIFDQYNSFCENAFMHTLLVFSPKTLIPTLPADSDDTDVKVAYAYESNFVISGHKELADALKSNTVFLTGELVEADNDLLTSRAAKLGADGLKKYCAAGGFDYPSVPEIFG